MSYHHTHVDSRPPVSQSASSLLSRIRERDSWSADALASVLHDHPDLVLAVYDRIEVLLHPEVLLGVAPPITREDWEKTSRSRSGVKRDVSDDELQTMNSLLEPMRERLQRSTARRHLRQAIQREFRYRGLPLTPPARRSDLGDQADSLAEPSFDRDLDPTPEFDQHQASAPASPPRPRGRPPLPEPTYPVTVMLTLREIEMVDRALARFNRIVKQSGGHRVKRNHLVQALLNAVGESGYDLSYHDTLLALRTDLVNQLRRAAERHRGGE